MRISDWSSDVCSSDLGDHPQATALVQLRQRRVERHPAAVDDDHAVADRLDLLQDVGRENDGRMLGEPPDEAAHLPDLRGRSEEHTSELQSLMRLSYAVFCLKKKK